MQDHVDKIMAQWAATGIAADVSPMAVLTRIFRLNKQMRQPLAATFRKHNLHDGDFDLLATLFRSHQPAGMTPNELRSSIVLSSGAMTNRLDGLESAGLIVRTANPQDRRSTLIKLTTKGRQTVEDSLTDYLGVLENLLSCLSTAERNTGAAILRKLLIHIEGTADE